MPIVELHILYVFTMIPDNHIPLAISFNIHCYVNMSIIMIIVIIYFVATTHVGL